MTIPRLLLAAAALGFVVCVACSTRPSVSASQTTTSSAPARQTAPAPTASHAAAQQAPAAITGTVAETMDAASYTYMKVKTASGDVWAAASQFKVKVGDTVSFMPDQPMENFHSQALKRDFPLIYFVSTVGLNGEAAPSAMPPGHPAVPANPKPAAVTGVIEPPKGATSVQDVWKTRKSLVGRSVTVRGKVVKYNGGILGVNWLHLQDGTGAASDGTNDLTVTSDADARVGDVVTVTGTVAIDKDLGAGYKYPVIVEHAQIARE